MNIFEQLISTGDCFTQVSLYQLLREDGRVFIFVHKILAGAGKGSFMAHPTHLVGRHKDEYVGTGKNRRYLNENSRFTLELDSPDAVREAHQEFARVGGDARITYLGELREESGRSFFFLSDPAKNWWEVSAPKHAAYQP